MNLNLSHFERGLTEEDLQANKRTILTSEILYLLATPPAKGAAGPPRSRRCPLPGPGDIRGPVAWRPGDSMRCSNCGTDNAAGSRFCNQCATPVNKCCAKCAFENTPEARFCAQCAAPLDPAGPIRAAAEPHDGLTGERRHLTVLFCDLVGSTEIAAISIPRNGGRSSPAIIERRRRRSSASTGTSPSTSATA